MAQQQQQQQQRACVVRLSPLLIAYGEEGPRFWTGRRTREEGIWESYVTRELLWRIDAMSLGMVLLNMLGIIFVPFVRGESATLRSSGRVLMPGRRRLLLVLLVLLALLQLLLIMRRRELYCRLRHRFALLNRVLRLGIMALLAVLNKLDAVSKWVALQQGPAGKGPNAASALLGFLLFTPLMQMQTSVLFLLPTTTTLLLQPLHFVVAAMWTWRSPTAMGAIPGVTPRAVRLCSGIRDAMCVLVYTLDQAAMPGVPGPGFSMWDSPNVCEGDAMHAQLLLFYNFALSFLLPFYVGYACELSRKRAFWLARGVAVAPDRSPLLPFPESRWLSHVLVCCVALVAAWFVAEALAPLMPTAAAA